MNGRNDDQLLIEAARAGHPGAFGELVRRYQGRLYPTLLRLVGSAEDAEDLLQEAFLRAYRKLGRFKGQSSFYTWLYALAVNLALSHRRRRKRPTRFSELCAENLGAIEPTDRPDRSDPTLPISQAEIQQQVQLALNDLSEEHRAVVVLKEYDGLRYEEIATILKIPVGTVRSRLHRARRELSDRLREVIEEFPDDPPSKTDPMGGVAVNSSNPNTTP